MKYITLSFIAIVFSVAVFAQIPAGYYDSATGSGYTLKTQLYNIIDGHTQVSYTPGVWDAFYTTDVDKYYENDGSVLDIYSENPTGVDPYNFVLGTDQDNGSSVPEGEKYNREHSFPRNWFGGSVAPMNTDIFHIYPTDKVVNNKRSNYPYGEVGTASWTSKNGSMLGSSNYSGYSGTVFEPIDEFKGDIARSYFYMATRYENVISSWPGSDMLDGSNDKCFSSWALSMLLEWHQNDPVSRKEIDRNNAIHDIQKNRNPFIDHPEYVCLIWGGDCGTALSEIFFEDFETATDNEVISINGWTTFSQEGTRKWEGRLYNSNKYAQMSAYSSAETSNITWMITPAIDLTNITTANFSFKSKDGHNNGDPVEVFISKNYTGTGDPTAAVWTKLNPIIATGTTSGYADNFTASGDVNIDSYCGGSIYIAYKYSGGDPSLTTTIQIDDVLITGVEGSSNSSPEITGISHAPTNPTSEEEVTVSATITDSNGSISSAKIKWGTSAGVYTNEITMSNSGDVYSGVIVKQTGGTVVYYIVEATDNESAKSASTEKNYTVEIDNVAPQITGVSHIPTEPTSEEEVTVSATITDSDGNISSAKVKWGTSTGVYSNEVTMSNSGDIYSGVIPKQIGGTKVYYIIEATDNDSDVNQSSESNYNVSEVNSIIDIKSIDLSIYPNPSQGILFIRIKESYQIQSIKVFNLIGEKIVEFDKINSNQKELNLDGLYKGIYLVQVKFEDLILSKKIILK